MEGRSTEEIAAELGIKESAVRHTVSRARASLRKVLTTLIVNEQTGLTALDALSTTYKKAAVLAHKSSKAALSLLLVITAFLGFNSMSRNEISVNPTIASLSAGEDASSTPLIASSTSPTASASPSTSTTTPSKKAEVATLSKKAQIDARNVNIAALSFFGLDEQGLPTGFSVTDVKNTEGIARLTKGTSVFGETGLVINRQLITRSIGPNLLIDQVITVDGAGIQYSAESVTVGFGGNWNGVDIDFIDSTIDRLDNGKYLITATFHLGYLIPQDFVMPTGRRGYDLADAPKEITTRILLNAGKSQVLAQAVQVNKA